MLGPGPDADDADPAADTAADRPGAIRWRTAFAEVFDAENSGRGGVGFDAVVGNPPWKGTAGRADISARIDGDTTAHLKRTFEAAAGPQPNLYAAFLERACRLAPGGRVALVVPDALLVRLSAAPARRFLLDAGGVTHLLRVGTVFADANEGAAVVVCAPETDTGADATGKSAIRTWFGDAEEFAVAARADSFEYGRLSRETVASEAYARFQLLRDGVAEGIFRKLERRDPLEAVGSVARGEEFGKRDDSVRESPADGTRPLVPGSAVRPYALRRGEIRHVDAEAVSKAVYDPPKLLCRQTGRFLVGTLDVEGLANLKSVYDVHVDPVHRSAGPADDERLLKHLLGLLNSRVYNYYHYVRRNAYPAQFPQQNQRNYETLPVWSGSVDDELVSLVDRRLAVGRERASLADDVASVVEFEDASVPLDRFDPEVVDDGLSRSHRAETPGLRIADLSVREAGDELTLRATYETDAGRETRDVLRFAAPSPRDAVVLSTWLPAVGAATATDRRACGLRPVGRSSQTRPRPVSAPSASRTPRRTPRRWRGAPGTAAARRHSTAAPRRWRPHRRPRRRRLRADGRRTEARPRDARLGVGVDGAPATFGVARRPSAVAVRRLAASATTTLPAARRLIAASRVRASRAVPSPRASAPMSLTQPLLDALVRYGYLGIFVFTFLETSLLFPLLPSELVVPAIAGVAVGSATALLVVGITVATGAHVFDGFAQLSSMSDLSGVAIDPQAVDLERDRYRIYVTTQATMLASGWFAGVASRGRYEALLHSGALVAVCHAVFAGAGLI
nr:hypothetical protein [Halogeometricum sp. CBA1124]